MAKYPRIPKRISRGVGTEGGFGTEILFRSKYTAPEGLLGVGKSRRESGEWLKWLSVIEAFRDRGWCVGSGPGGLTLPTHAANPPSLDHRMGRGEMRRESQEPERTFLDHITLNVYCGGHLGCDMDFLNSGLV